MLRSRYYRIVRYFFGVILHLVWWELVLPRLGLARRVRRTREQRLRKIAARYRVLAVELGGVLIKMGQFLSARVDVLPLAVTEELAGLQDEVPPEDFGAIYRLLEAELGAPLERRFARFEARPLAAASLGQVHRAWLAQPGDLPEQVVVKVQRPGIEQIIATDLRALRTVGKWLQRYRPIRRRADVPALLDEFARILYEEIDYLAEGRNAETFAANFADRAGVRIPRVLWEHTTRRVLTLEDVYAIKITDYAAIEAAGVSRGEVARRLFDTYLEQIFRHEFFHADPHPGNLFVEVPSDGDADAWRLTFVDFGMVGRITPAMRAGLREGVIALATRDARRLVQAYQMLGMLLPNADLELIEQAEMAVFDRFWGKSMGELAQIEFAEMHEFAREFRQLVYTLPFQVPHDLILLGRAVAILAGMCTGLDPQFNVWHALAPFARQLLAEEDGDWEQWLGKATDWVLTGLRLPLRLDNVLEIVERGRLQVAMPELSAHLKSIEASMRRMVGALVFAALLMGSVQLYLAGELLAAGVLSAGALFSLGWMALTRPRRDG